MSMRTIFEINHDYLAEIGKDPERFVKELKLYIASGDIEEAKLLEKYGIRRAWLGHHSTERKVVTNDGEYPL